MALFEEGAEQGRDRSNKRAGIPARRVAEGIKKGGRLSEADLSALGMEAGRLRVSEYVWRLRVRVRVCAGHLTLQTQP